MRPYAALSLVSLAISLYLTWHLLGGFGQRMIAGNPDDVRLFEWYLVHGPWAVLHGHDPLLFTTMNAPAGVNGMWNTPLLVPALISYPVTALAGPLAAYNTLFVLGLAAGPVCAFALLRRFVRSDWAAAVGGLVFGFSPAVLAAGLGHLDLVLIGLLPVILMLVLDLATGRRAALGGGLALGLAAAAQLFISEEILFQAGLVIVVCGALLLLTAPRTITRAGLARLGRGGAVAAVVFLVICAGPLWLQLFGPLHQHGSPFTLSFFEADLRGFIEPSHRFWLSTPASSAFAAHYGGGPAEYLAYLGLPLLLAALLTGLLRISGAVPAAAARHRPALRAVLAGQPAAGERPADRGPAALGDRRALADLRLRAARPVRVRGRAGRGRAARARPGLAGRALGPDRAGAGRGAHSRLPGAAGRAALRRYSSQQNPTLL